MKVLDERGARRLSVVIPAYREQDVIANSIAAVLEFLPTFAEEFEVVVVDDGSPDETAARVEPFVDGDRVRLVRHASNRGKGAAVRSGVLAARYERVLITDADLSMPVEHVADFWPYADTAEIVVASKRCPEARLDYPFARRLAGALGQSVVRLFADSGVADTQGGFKLMDSAAAKSLFRVQVLDGFWFDFEVLFLARRFGYRIVERPFHGTHRLEGSVGFASYVRTLGEVWRVAWRRVTGGYPGGPQ